MFLWNADANCHEWLKLEGFKYQSVAADEEYYERVGKISLHIRYRSNKGDITLLYEGGMHTLLTDSEDVAMSILLRFGYPIPVEQWLAPLKKHHVVKLPPPRDGILWEISFPIRIAMAFQGAELRISRTDGAVLCFTKATDAVAFKLKNIDLLPG